MDQTNNQSFEKMFPESEVGFKVEVDGDMIEWTDRLEGCSVCFKPNYFISESFHKSFCSKSCLDHAWQKYWAIH